MNLGSPFFTIIIPVYNGAKYINAVLHELFEQTNSSFELIIVDDGSTDQSGILCDKYISIDNRIKVIHKTNGGLISARKAGIELSTGDYILYVDGDDWIEKDLVKYYIEQASKYNADIVVSSHMENLAGRIEILTNTTPPGFYDKNKLISDVYPKMLYNGKFSQFGIFSYVWGKLYRREILIQNQLNVDENIFIGEDAACLYPTLIDANSLIVLEQPYYHYRQRVDSLIKTHKEVEIAKISTFYSYLKEAFDKKGFLNLMLSQLQFFALSLLTVRSDGPQLDNTTSLYPFDKIKSGDNLIICGAGTFGQHLYKRISKRKTHNIVTWVDEWYKHYSKLGLSVVGFDQINSLKYDAIVIALIDEDISNQTRSKLIECGVDENKIFQVSHYNKKENIEHLLLEYKINL
jgi:glycosyltransferase involved in cell wall biosynthesis